MSLLDAVLDRLRALGPDEPPDPAEATREIAHERFVELVQALSQNPSKYELKVASICNSP